MTTFKDYTKEEKECLLSFLSAMYSIAEETNVSKNLTRQAELLNLVSTVFDARKSEKRSIEHTGGILGIKSNIPCGISSGSFSLLWRNAADIMKICIEFALLGMDDRDIQCIENSDYRCDYNDIFKELSESDFEKLASVVYREYNMLGAEGTLEKYRKLCSLCEIEDGYVNIYIPEINIPTFTLKVEIEDGCVEGEWDDVYEAIDSFKEIFGSDNDGSCYVDAAMKRLGDSIKKQIDEAEKMQLDMLD